jgi:transcriptional regulator with XRE-family HTH domain
MLTNTPTMQEIAASLRTIRKQKGMTLKDVEESSAGRWKAVVVGSYERCDRALSLNKAIGLAAFYEVPLDHLLGLRTHSSNTQANPLILDLRKIASLSQSDERYKTLYTYLRLIAAKRRDWNGEVISLRDIDLTNIALILLSTEDDIRIWFERDSLYFAARTRQET